MPRPFVYFPPLPHLAPTKRPDISCELAAAFLATLQDIRDLPEVPEY